MKFVLAEPITSNSQMDISLVKKHYFTSSNKDA